MRSSRIVTWLVAILVISALLAGCRGGNTQDLISITDDTGQVISLARFPQRIVSMGPMITEILVALGASPRIVGVDNFSRLPDSKVPIPRLGEHSPRGDWIRPEIGIDTDAIVALHPDLVIADARYYSRALFPGLDKAGISIVYLNPVVGVTGTLKRLLSLGAIVGESDKASRLVASYEKRKQTVVERVQDLPKVRVVLLRWVSGGPPAPGVPVTEDNEKSEFIQLAGGVNVFTSSPEDKNMVQKLIEQPHALEPYIAKNPEVMLVLFDPEQMLLDRPGWERVDAVQKGRVHAIGEITPLTVLDRLEEIARLLHPGIGEFEKTMTTPPNTPTKPSPLNHATGVPVKAVLRWVGGDPDEGDWVVYIVYFGTNENPPALGGSQSLNQLDPGILSYNTKYYWKILAKDNHGATSEGPIWDFTTRSE